MYLQSTVFCLLEKPRGIKTYFFKLINIQMIFVVLMSHAEITLSAIYIYFHAIIYSTTWQNCTCTASIRTYKEKYKPSR
jgi:hypothetical protein